MSTKGLLLAGVLAAVALAGCATNEPTPQPVPENTSVSQSAYSDKLGKLGAPKSQSSQQAQANASAQ
ncbi:MAG: hypothetical protein A3J38_08135 [Gammaproteobacteria bacterium RIFCSPHIGHO2_12_FULL_45_9]|nr:MAG: hypothetical protein A3J38_08135 [Gammaproteobacteria bacterium RIFCSPHIGHO2_12_FULL_45_9]